MTTEKLDRLYVAIKKEVGADASLEICPMVGNSLVTRCYVRVSTPPNTEHVRRVGDTPCEALDEIAAWLKERVDHKIAEAERNLANAKKAAGEVLALVP